MGQGLTGEAVLGRVRAHLDATLGAGQKASVTFLGVEQIDVHRYAATGDVVYVTVGCSRHPMQDAAATRGVSIVSETGPRAELVMRLQATRPYPGLHRRLAAMAAAPAVDGLVLAADAVLRVGEPLWDGAPFNAVLLTGDELGDVPLGDSPLGDVRPGGRTESAESARHAEPVRLLRADPITENEAAWVRLRGADALRQAWREAGVDPADPERRPATL